MVNCGALSDKLMTTLMSMSSVSYDESKSISLTPVSTSFRTEEIDNCPIIRFGKGNRTRRWLLTRDTDELNPE
jgi:hypothetical protein